MSQRPEKWRVLSRGDVIVTFECAVKAADVRQRLLEGGNDENDVQVMDNERVRQGTSEDLRQLSPVIKARPWGSEQDLIRGHQSQAAKATRQGRVSL